MLDVHNLDIGYFIIFNFNWNLKNIRVTGNLGGQIVILIPIALFGIVQVNAHQVEQIILFI